MDTSPVFYDQIEQGSTKWHELRLGRFGSTDAKAVSVNGKGLVTLCLEKACERITGKSDAPPLSSYHIERGNRLEPIARTLYEIETEFEILETGYISLGDYIGGSPDGIIESENAIIEIKCPCNKVFLEYVNSGKIKSDYIFQMQHLMYIGNFDYCDFIVFSEDFNDIKIKRIDRNEEQIEKIKVGINNGIAKIEESIQCYNSLGRWLK